MHKAHGEACERVPWVGRGDTWYILATAKYHEDLIMDHEWWN
jgi:hypothetical protein